MGEPYTPPRRNRMFIIVIILLIRNCCYCVTIDSRWWQNIAYEPFSSYISWRNHQRKWRPKAVGALSCRPPPPCLPGWTDVAGSPCTWRALDCLHPRCLEIHMMHSCRCLNKITLKCKGFSNDYLHSELPMEWRSMSSLSIAPFCVLLGRYRALQNIFVTYK